MQACPPGHRRRGFSLIESMIVMGVMLVIMGAAHSFIGSGVDFYLRSVQNLEVQQQTLVGLTKMADELENSNFDKIFVPPTPNDDKIIFPSPAGLDGKVGSNLNGVLLWRTTVCFMPRVMPDGDVILERKVDPHPDGEVDYPPDPLTIDTGGPRDLAYFAPRPAVGLVLRHLDELKFEKGADKITIKLKVKFSTRTTDSMTVSTNVFARN